MLDHLDDPRLFTPSARFRGRVEERSRQLQRRRHRLTACVTALVVVAGLGAATVAYVARRNADITRIAVAMTPSTDGATNVLVVGTDGNTGARADSVMLVRFNNGGSIAALSIPRDLWDAEHQARVADTYSGGVQTLIDSVTTTLGIPVDHYVQLDFAGFRELVNELGGLRIAVDLSIRDKLTGLELAATPCATLDGQTTLALVRSRHLEYLDSSGMWRSDPTGDLGRIARAQAVMAVALATLADIGPDPVTIDRVSRILADHATLDRGLSLGRLTELARSLAAAGPLHTTTPTLPVAQATTPGGTNVLELATGAGEILHAFGGPDSPDVARPPDAERVTAIAPVHPC